MTPPSQKRILREDVKGAPDWIDPIIDTLNSFMESVYQALTKNITLTENIACSVRELTVRTSSVYPIMDKIEFASNLKTRAIGVQIMQAYEKFAYDPVAANVAWTENNGTIVIHKITGLDVSKVYIIRLLVT